MTTDPRTVANPGRKRCLLCGHRIPSYETAMRCTDIERTSNPMGKVRFWLCRGCAADIERAIKGIRAQKLGLMT